MRSHDFEDQSMDGQNIFEQPIAEKFTDIFAALHHDFYANEDVSTEGLERNPEMVAEMHSTISCVPGDASAVFGTEEDQTKAALAMFAGDPMQAQDRGRLLGTYYVCYPVGQGSYYYFQPEFSLSRSQIPWATKITAYETSVAGWVSFDSVSGHTGYIETFRITDVSHENIVDAGTRYINCPAGKSIKLLVEPKTGSSQYTYIFCKGRELQAHTIGNTGWSGVKDQAGFAGYCFNSNLTTTKPTMIGARYVVATTSELLSVYAEAATGAERLFGVAWGELVNVYDGGSAEWALIQNIQYPWNMGYFKAAYLYTPPPPGSSNLGTRYINYPHGYPTWLYSEPTAASTSICSLERGTPVTAYSIGNDQWTYVVAPSGQVGYCYTSRLSINQPKAIIASLGEKYIDVPVGYAIYAYDEPSSSANRTFNNARGAKIKAFDIGMADWLCFQSSATVQEGYMPKAYVSDYEVRTGTSIGTRYANIISSYSFGLYKYSNTTSGVRHNLLGGTAVTVYDVGVSGWKLVQSASGLFGYCYDYYLASNPPGAGTNLGTRFVDVASGSTLPVYASCSAGTTIGNLNPGTEVHAFDCSVANFVYIRTKAAPIVEGFCRTASLSTTPPGSGNNGLLSAVANTWSVQIWNDENRTGSPSFVSPSTGRMPFTVKEYGNMAMYKTYHGFYPLSEKYVMKSVIDLVENGERTAGQRIADIANFWAVRNVNKKDLGMGTDPKSQWCMWFANWMVGAAGLGQQNSTWVNDNNAATAYAEMSRLGLIKSAPVVGSIFFTKYDSPNVDHCGIVVSEPRTENGKTVVTVVEGDYQGQQVVTTRSFELGLSTTLGFGVPAGV